MYYNIIKSASGEPKFVFRKVHIYATDRGKFWNAKHLILIFSKMHVHMHILCRYLLSSPLELDCVRVRDRVLGNLGLENKHTNFVNYYKTDCDCELCKGVPRPRNSSLYLPTLKTTAYYSMYVCTYIGASLLLTCYLAHFVSINSHKYLPLYTLIHGERK